MTNLLKRAALSLVLLFGALASFAVPAIAATIPFANGVQYTTGTLTTASGAGSESNYVIPIRNIGFNILLTGTASASVVLERSFDGGTTWAGVYAAGVQLYSWSYASTTISETAAEPEFNVLYRLRCTAYTSGTVTYRISQVTNS